MVEVVALTQALLRCRSVTPADDGAQAVLAQALTAIGFVVTRLEFGGVENLYAERGGTLSGAEICFAGHTDVVPAGDAKWSNDPFGGVVRDGVIYGRGACDMKGAIAAFAAAAAQAPEARLSLLITGDEEGAAVNGTVKVLEWMRDQHKRPAFCVVGEPTSERRLGDRIKIGRRGSLNAQITVTGRQGHVAYPHLADNPVHRLVAALNALAAHRLDEGTAWFEPSSLQITSVDVGNPAANVIPGAAMARLNVRFNDLHNEASLTQWLRETLAVYAPDARVEISCSGEAFLTAPGTGTEALRAAITEVSGVVPEQSTGGGTSDARFIAKHFPVAEFGLVGATMHQADEAVAVLDLVELTEIYRNLIARFCG